MLWTPPEPEGCLLGSAQTVRWGPHTHLCVSVLSTWRKQHTWCGHEGCFPRLAAQETSISGQHVASGRSPSPRSWGPSMHLLLAVAVGCVVTGGSLRGGD